MVLVPQLNKAVMLYACCLPCPSLHTPLHPLQPSSMDVALTATQTFQLHSRPTATKKILLDFDGHITTQTAWNKVLLLTIRFEFLLQHCLQSLLPVRSGKTACPLRRGSPSDCR